jgi:hypothetical protein
LAHTLIEEIALRLVTGGKLTILIGAGLSMAVPTELDGARQLAERIAQAVRVLHPEFPISDDLGVIYDQLKGEYGGQGVDLFLRTFQELGPAYYPENSGHISIVKLFLEDTVESIYSLNLDNLVEKSAQNRILPAGWQDARDIRGNSSTHGLAVRWSEVGIEGMGIPRLNKIHGCIVRDPANTVWSATELASADWPALAVWAKPGFEADVQQHALLIVGCGSPVVYLNSSIERGRVAAPRRDSSYLVSMEQFNDYSTIRNPSLLVSAEITEQTYCRMNAAEFLKELHEDVCRRRLYKIESSLMEKVTQTESYAVSGSVTKLNWVGIKESIHQVGSMFRDDLELLQRFLKRSLLWARDLSPVQVAFYYVSIGLNENLVSDLWESLSMLRLFARDCEIDPGQTTLSAQILDGVHLLIIHCRAFLALQIREELFAKLLEAYGPTLPQRLTVLLVHANASAADIRKIPPLNRTRAISCVSRANVTSDIPANWKITTSGDTIDRAPFLAADAWKANMQEQLC